METPSPFRRGILLDHQRTENGGPACTLGAGTMRDLMPELPRHGFRYFEVFLDPALDDRAEIDGFLGFVARARDLGIELWSMHMPFSRDISVTDPVKREEALEGVLKTVDLAGKAGAKFAVVHPGSVVPDGEMERRTDTAVAGLLRIHAALSERGMRLAVENMHPRHVGGGGKSLRALLERLPADAGACLDSGHANMTDGDPAAVARILSGRIHTLHVHDNDGKSDLHRIPGEGNIDWPAYVRALDAAGFTGVFMLETGGKRQPLEVLAKAKDALDRFLPPPA